MSSVIFCWINLSIVQIWKFTFCFSPSITNPTSEISKIPLQKELDSISPTITEYQVIVSIVIYVISR